MKKDNNNLPVVKNNNFRTKMRKAIFIILSSLRIASSIGPTVDASAKTNAEETIEYNDRQNRREKFIEGITIRKINENIVNQLVERRGQEYSLVTGKGEQVREILIKTLDKIDENFNKNAKKKGKMAFGKEEFKNEYIELIGDLNDIFCVGKDTKENQYKEYFDSRELALVSGVYFAEEKQMNSGTIPENSVLIKDYGRDIEYIMIHELTHKKQGKIGSAKYINHNNVIKMLREGHSNNIAEYVRDTVLDAKEFTITRVSINNYNMHSVIYNKLAFLVGEKQMDEYMQKSKERTLNKFLQEELDNKYGKETRKELFKYVTNLSFYTRYVVNDPSEKFEKLYQEIDRKNEKVQKEIEEKGESDVRSTVLEVNNNFKAMLDKVYNKDTKTIDKKAFKEERNKQLKGLEMKCLECINKDVESIQSKNDAIDYVQLWDYYRNRCAISKYYEVGEETVELSGNFSKLKEVQKNLYNKCKKYKALNIKDETTFDKLLEAQLYDVSSAKVSYNKNKTIMKISDEYIITEFYITTKKDGSKEYDSKEYKNDEGIVKGSNILAKKELDKER